MRIWIRCGVVQAGKGGALRAVYETGRSIRTRLLFWISPVQNQGYPYACMIEMQRISVCYFTCLRWPRRAWSAAMWSAETGHKRIRGDQEVSDAALFFSGEHVGRSTSSFGY